MTTAARTARASLHVTIVSANPETSDGLQTYLTEAGVNARATRQLGEDVPGEPAPSAVVLFPDEFPTAEVLREVARLERDRPYASIVIVTRAPRQFERTSTEQGPERVVFPKPAWGWTILDAIRAASGKGGAG